MAMKSNDTNTATTADVVETKYKKEQIISSKTYAKYRDMLSAVLNDGESYSKSELSKIIKNGGIV